MATVIDDRSDWPECLRNAAQVNQSDENRTSTLASETGNHTGRTATSSDRHVRGDNRQATNGGTSSESGRQRTGEESEGRYAGWPESLVRVAESQAKAIGQNTFNAELGGSVVASNARKCIGDCDCEKTKSVDCGACGCDSNRLWTLRNRLTDLWQRSFDEHGEDSDVTIELLSLLEDIELAMDGSVSADHFSH